MTINLNVFHAYTTELCAQQRGWRLKINQSSTNQHRLTHQCWEVTSIDQHCHQCVGWLVQNRALLLRSCVQFPSLIHLGHVCRS